MPFRAILFDLDGTLLDTLADIAQAANEALELEGLPDPLRGRLPPVHRRRRRHALPPGPAARPRRRSPRSDAASANFQVDLWASPGTSGPGPTPASPSCSTPWPPEGSCLAVLSNKPDDFTQLFGEPTWPAGRSGRSSASATGSLASPTRPAALEIAASLGIEPASCLFVGDSGVDMQTARAAGMFPVGVSWGFQPVEMLRAAGAGAIIDHPSELLELLDGQRVRLTDPR